MVRAVWSWILAGVLWLTVFGMADYAYADQCALARRLVEKTQTQDISSDIKINILSKAQTLCPSLGWAFSQEAVLWADADDPVNAKRLIQEAIEKSPDSPNVQRDAVHVWRITGDYKKAAQLISLLMQEYGNDPEFLLDAALVYKGLGNDAQAESTLRSCALLDDKMGHCDFELGKYYLNKGRTTEAEQYFTNAMQKNPSAYTSYTIEEAMAEYRNKRIAYMVGAAAAVLLLLAFILWRMLRKKKAADTTERKRTTKDVRVRIRVIGDIDSGLDNDSVDIAADRHMLEVETTEDAYVCMFAITNIGGVIPLNTGSTVEVFPVGAGEKIQGTLFLRMRGQIAHCFAVASKARFSFDDHIQPYIEEALQKPVTTEEPSILPLPAKYFGQAHVVIQNQ